LAKIRIPSAAARLNMNLDADFSLRPESEFANGKSGRKMI